MFYVNDEPEGKFLYTKTIKLYCIVLHKMCVQVAQSNPLLLKTIKRTVSADQSQFALSVDFDAMVKPGAVWSGYDYSWKTVILPGKSPLSCVRPGDQTLSQKHQSVQQLEWTLKWTVCDCPPVRSKHIKSSKERYLLGQNTTCQFWG